MAIIVNPVNPVIPFSMLRAGSVKKNGSGNAGEFVRYVFTNKHGRKLVRNICRDFGKIAVRAGLVDKHKEAMYTMHDLRAAFVTNLLMAGVNVKLVQKLAGRADISTTLKFYTAVSEKGMIAAIEKMSDFTKYRGSVNVYSTNHSTKRDFQDTETWNYNRKYYNDKHLWACSSAVEQGTHNPLHIS